MRTLFYLSLLWVYPQFSLAQFQPENIKIARDAWGVPHIKAPTDAEVAYGLAWATCEDDFKTMQEQLLAIRGNLGEIQGKNGAFIDFAIKFMGLEEIVSERYESDLSPTFKKFLNGYVAGANTFAEKHPDKILLKKLFPLTGKDIVKGYLMGLVNLSGADGDIQKILNGNVLKEEKENFPTGSNAIAISRSKTKDGKTYLAINSHQPLEGWYSWYEAHLISDEGLNILGGTFPGGVTIFHGANEYLGWAHTVNSADFSDVFKLEMHPEKKLTYKFDGAWYKLEKKKYKGKVNIKGIKIPISQKVYKSKYGATFKNDHGFYAWRFAANRDIRAPEQWYHMNKATDFDSFKKALTMLAIPSTNIVYADREDNIYYISNGRFPYRNPQYNWDEVLPGNTSETLYDEKNYPIDSLPQVLNPKAGYVFNTNQTPFHATAEGENVPESSINKTMGYKTRQEDNNRSMRFAELIGQYDKLDYKEFKRIKFDLQYPSYIRSPYIVNLEDLLHLDPNSYPDISQEIRFLNNWDKKMAKESIGATFFGICFDQLYNKMRRTKGWERGHTAKEADFVKAIRNTSSHLKTHFGKLEVPWGMVQRHTRGDVDLPLMGGPDVLAAMYSSPIDNGRYRGRAGESYIELVRFSKDGVEIESVNAYGSSAVPGDPHSTDQMELFTQQQLKPMTLSWEEVLKSAERVYHPQ